MNVMLVSVAVWVGSDMGPRRARDALGGRADRPAGRAGRGDAAYRYALAGRDPAGLNMDVAISIGVLASTPMSLSEMMRNGATPCSTARPC